MLQSRERDATIGGAGAGAAMAMVSVRRQVRDRGSETLREMHLFGCEFRMADDGVRLVIFVR
jgi:hypothetical protein